MTPTEIIEELAQAEAALDDTYKNSRYYREYLAKVAEDLIELTFHKVKLK